MKIVRWFVRVLSGDDGYPLNCEEWQVERMQTHYRRSHALVRSNRRNGGWL